MLVFVPFSRRTVAALKLPSDWPAPVARAPKLAGANTPATLVSTFPAAAPRSTVTADVAPRLRKFSAVLDSVTSFAARYVVAPAPSASTLVRTATPLLGSSQAFV